MSRSIAALLTVILLAGTAPVLSASPAAAGAQPWIVQLRADADATSLSEGAGRRLGFRPTHVYERALRGFSARLNAAQRAALLADPRVVAVQPDLPTQIAAEPQPAPPGISRVGADPSAIRALDGSDPELPVDIAVLDTGVQAAHPDLRVVGGKNCTTTTSSWDVDRHGHGTHVAGTAAARDNGFGVVGVAPGARIWSVKVLNNKGNGLLSWLICGLDWVAAKRDPVDASQPRIEVVSMSLRMSGSDDGNCGLSNADLLHQAVCRLDRAGVTIVAAAGNDSTSAAKWVPAAYDEAITVSALADYDGAAGGTGTKPLDCPRPDGDDSFAVSFSNYGSDVDLIAPGVCIVSTFPTDLLGSTGYALMSGTSMATPHVAGGAALYHLYELGQGRSRPTPEQTRAALHSSGTLDWKTASDPDGKPEPLLAVGSLELPPGFEIGATPSSQARGPGETAVFDIWLARLGGFSAGVQLTLSGQPEGSSWTIEGGSFAAGERGWRRLSIALPASGQSGTMSVVITGTSGALSRSTAVLLQFETGIVGAPGAPRMNLRKRLVSGTVALPVRIKWDAISGAERYELEVSRDGGLWAPLSLPSRTATALNTTAWPASLYRYRVRAKVNGSWGKWLLGEPSAARPHYANEAVTLSGNWTTYAHSSTYSEVPAYSKQAGARAVLDFVGRSVSWITTRGPSRGVARVYVDGVLAAKIDLYAASVQHRYVAFARSWRGEAAHRIVIEVRGTSGRARVDLDALVVVSLD